jgi:hypothetical protein
MANVILLIWASTAGLPSVCVSGDPTCGKYSISVTEPVMRSSALFPTLSLRPFCPGDCGWGWGWGWVCACATTVVGDIPEAGLGMASSVWIELEAVTLSGSAVLTTSTGADLAAVVFIAGVVIFAAGAGAGAGAGAFLTGESPVPGVGPGVSAAVDFVALHLLSFHREPRRRRLSLWARALVASITGLQTSPGTRTHGEWDRGPKLAFEELGSSFVGNATEAEEGGALSGSSSGAG